MKGFTNANPRDVQQAVTLLTRARSQGLAVSIAGGGTDLLGMVKEHLVSPDVLLNLKTVAGLDRIDPRADHVEIGGLATLDAVSRDPAVRRRYAVLAEAAESVGTPQIRNVGTLAGNICQRPWCWYFRNGFPCLKNGGNLCYAAGGENQFHAIFGGGPSYIVHPSDTAPALVALDARLHIAGASERVVPAGEFFALPRIDPARENVLGHDDLLVKIEIPAARPGTRSTYHKVLDREAWTHAVVSAALVLEMDRETCRGARLVLGGVAPIPWRLPDVETLLTGQRITADLAAKAGEIAVEGAKPLAKNGYKVPLTRTVVRRTISELASRA